MAGFFGEALFFGVLGALGGIALGRLLAEGAVQLLAATAVLIPAILLSYAALASRVRGFLASRKARSRLNKSAAVIMVVAGVGVAVS